MPQQQSSRRRRRPVASGAAVTLLLALGVLVPAAAAASSATITRATLPSFFVDLEGTFFPATCEVTQVVTDSQRIETFTCTFDDAVPAPYVCDSSCTWGSDFDGAPAIRTHFLITRTGVMHGWALY